jgi:uncharacterized protein (TIGR02246 family)
MRTIMRAFIWLAVPALLASCTARAQGGASTDRVAAEIVALERAALDRWVTLDPQGYLDLFAEEIAYFDPTTPKRIDGRRAMEERLAPMKNVKLPFKEVRYEMVDPKVQQHGDVALLTFNLVNYGKPLDRAEEVLVARWNSTELYRRIDGKWRIVHSHWSRVQPDVKPAM